jgi:hypothetical protein
LSFDPAAPDAAKTVGAVDRTGAVVGLQPVGLPGDQGVSPGLLTTTDAGQITLSRQTTTGDLEPVAVVTAAGAGPLSAAVGVSTGTGIDVYSTRVGSSEPSVLSVVTRADPAPGPPQPAPRPTPAPAPSPREEPDPVLPPELPEEVPGDPTGEVPEPPGEAPAAGSELDGGSLRDGIAAPTSAPAETRLEVAVAAAPGEITLGGPDSPRGGAPTPSGEEPAAEFPGDESSTEWELFYLDNLRRLEQFNRPGQAPADPNRGRPASGRPAPDRPVPIPDAQPAAGRRPAQESGRHPVLAWIGSADWAPVVVGDASLAGSDDPTPPRSEAALGLIAFWSIWDRMKRARTRGRREPSTPAALLRPVTREWP